MFIIKIFCDANEECLKTWESFLVWSVGEKQDAAPNPRVAEDGYISVWGISIASQWTMVGLEGGAVDGFCLHLCLCFSVFSKFSTWIYISFWSRKLREHFLEGSFGGLSLPEEYWGRKSQSTLGTRWFQPFQAGCLALGACGWFGQAVLSPCLQLAAPSCCPAQLLTAAGQPLELGCDEVFSGQQTNWKNDNGECFFHESKYFQFKNVFILLRWCSYLEIGSGLQYPFERWK